MTTHLTTRCNPAAQRQPAGGAAPWLLLAALAAAASPLRAEAATSCWRAADGSATVEAELVESRTGWAALRTADGLVHVLPHARFSPDDQLRLAAAVHGMGESAASVHYCAAQPADAPTAPVEAAAPRPKVLDPAEAAARIDKLTDWRGQIESRLERYVKERPGEKGILRTRLEMSLCLIQLELAYWTVFENSLKVKESPADLVSFTDDLMSEIDEDLLNDADKRVKRILDLWRRRVSDRQIAFLEKQLKDRPATPSPATQLPGANDLFTKRLAELEARLAKLEPKQTPQYLPAPQRRCRLFGR